MTANIRELGSQFQEFLVQQFCRNSEIFADRVFADRVFDEVCCPKLKNAEVFVVNIVFTDLAMRTILAFTQTYI